MKRPQFGLRLLLLLVALAAAIAGWLTWVEQVRRTTCAGEVYKLPVVTRSELKLRALDHRRILDELKRMQQIFKDPNMQSQVAEGIKAYEAELEGTMKQIAELSER